MASLLPVTGSLPESWKVRLPVFEGPLDLLLQLIKVNEIEITDIPVALVCDQYHEYLELMDVLNLDVAGDYVYMAAYLIHLKSKMLLPKPKTLEGKVIEEDPREDLVRRLLEYRKLKEAAQTLAEVDSVRHGIWLRRSDEVRQITRATGAEMDISDLSLFDLLRTFKGVLERFEREHPDPMQLRGEAFSVRAQIERYLRELRPGRPQNLIDDLRSLTCRPEAVAAFLAVLEMARMLLVRVMRSDSGTIVLHRTTREIQAEELEAIQG